VQHGVVTELHLSGPAGWLATEARIRGWREALGVVGAPALDPVPTSWDAASGFAAAEQVTARDDVTAVFVANDQTALGLVRGLTELGVRVPQDVSVVGFDDFPESSFFSPPLTTMRVDFEALGRLAVDKVLALIAGDELDSGALVVPELVVRGSCGPPRVRGDPRSTVPKTDHDRDRGD
jgi:DNA-binding LacI/PurR family transcriptional regulator